MSSRLNKPTKMESQTKPPQDEAETSKGIYETSNGDFYKFQRKFRLKFPETSFENESVLENSIETSMCGFNGNLEDLLRSQTREVKFSIDDGRVVVRWSSQPKQSIWVDYGPEFVFWSGVILVLSTFIHANRYVYRRSIGLE